MKTLAKCHACNHCVIGELTFENILIGPDKLPGLSRNGPQDCTGPFVCADLKRQDSLTWPFYLF